MDLRLTAKGVLLALAVLVLGVVAIWQGRQWSDRILVDDLRNVAEERLNLYQSTLNSALEKYSYLPFLLAGDENIRSLLMQPDAERLAVQSANVSRTLVSTNKKSGTDVLFILNAKGTTLAASNWQEQLSFVGRNYAFRPYFTDAMQGREGGFFAIGATTGKAGYFMSYPVRDGSEIIGAAVVKIDLSPLQRDWRDGGETVFVSDANGVIFLSSQDQWKFHTLAPLSDLTKALIRNQKQYSGKDLTVLDVTNDTIAGAKTVSIDNHPYLHFTRALKDFGWKLHYFSSVKPVEDRRQDMSMMGVAVMVLLATFLLYWRERQQKILSRRRAREAEKIAEINRQLELEIVERRSAEAELRETQAELVQAGKLAALGKMSAAIAHEINQPISAIRTFSASARVMLQRGMTDNIALTLDEISGLTERMGVITGQLKVFARKAPARLDRLDVRDAILHVEKIMRPRADEEQCSLNIELTDGPVFVKADMVRLEQVFTNLLSNALDAVRDRPEKNVDIRLSQAKDFAEVQVLDSGSGLSRDVLERLFDPFFTTKDVGDGVGLGLSITYGIVTDLDGEIRVANTASGGAEFVVKLPLYGEDSD